MRLGLLVSNGLVLGAIGWMAIVGGAEQKPARVLARDARAGVSPADFLELERRAATSPTAPAVTALASAYLDRNEPGLASAVLERAPGEVRQRPEVAHLYARALFHRGHAREALAVARDASDSCAEDGRCAPWVAAKTARQTAFFEQVVAAGVDDPQRDPAATMAAYERSAREVRLVALR